MLIYTFFELYPIMLILLVCVLISLIIKIIEQKRASRYHGITEFSFQKFAKFFGNTVLPDNDFDNKMIKICELIVKNKEIDIKKIAQLSNCEYDECILKIKYLKNKRKIGDYYIDYEKSLIKPCTKDDKKLIAKYSPYIYNHHYQIAEIARRLPNATVNNLKELEEQVLNELDYLDKKNLINGLNIDKVDKKIIYYTIEKHKKEKDYISLNCENCGALNDVPRMGKARCEYCETIIEDIAEK